jgi:uncharacterized protein
MKTVGSLSARSKSDLAALAQKRGVRGWQAMDKPALLKALSKPAAPAKTAPKSAPKPTPKAAPKAAAKPAAKSATRITKPAKPAVPKKPTLQAAKPQPLAKPQAAKLQPTAKPQLPAKPQPQVLAKPQAQPAKLQPTAKPQLLAKPQAATPGASPKPTTPTTTLAPKPPATALAPKPTANGTHKTVASTGAKMAPKAPESAKLPPAKPVTKPLVQRATETPVRTSTPMAKDRIILAVSNPYWLHAYWELSPNSVQRAEAALKQDWHGARLIIRLFDVTSLDTTSTSETPVRDIIVQNGGRTWYIDVPQPPRTYRADIGYVSRRGEFHVLARSNVVTPPKAGTGEPGEVLDTDWDDADAKWKAERMLAMSSGFESGGSAELREFLEERTGRSLGPPKETAFGTGATPPNSVKKFYFEIDAKLIVFGRTDPTAHLTLNNDPIKLNSDGTFRTTFNLPDSRQIIPAVAASADGVEERTIILAVERNTKHLDPMIHDQMNEI